MDMKETLISHAVKLAEKNGYRNVTRDEVAASAKVGAGTVTYYFNPISKLRTAVIAYAISERLLLIIGQAIADKHPLTDKLPADLRRSAVSQLARA